MLKGISILKAKSIDSKKSELTRGLAPSERCQPSKSKARILSMLIQGILSALTLPKIETFIYKYTN
jgi:hypothetical protein